MRNIYFKFISGRGLVTSMTIYDNVLLRFDITVLILSQWTRLFIYFSSNSTVIYMRYYMQSEYRVSSTSATEHFPGCKPKPLTHRCSVCEQSWTESSQRRGKLRAIAQCEHYKATHQQNSSLPLQDSNPVCSGHAFQENYSGRVCYLWGIGGA